MTPRTASDENKSLRTFFIYSAIVLFFILISLGIKAFTVIQASKFDGKQQFILLIAEKEVVKEIAIFSPSERTITQVALKGAPVKVDTAGSVLNILPDGFVSLSAPSESSITETLKQIAFQFTSVKTNVTFFDIISLIIVAQQADNQVTEEIVITKNNEEIGSQVNNLFVNDTLFAENVSIEIVNASKTPGIGTRLENALKHLGCNIIAVSSARDQEKESKILYFGERTYTLTKLEKLLGYPSEKTDRKTIADIVIIIGNDKIVNQNF